MPAAPDKALLPMDWPVGMKYRIEIAAEKLNVGGGSAGVTERSRTEILGEVIRRNEDAIIMAWTYGDTVVEKRPANASADLLLYLLEQANGLPVHFSVNLDGNPSFVVNGDEIGSHYAGIFATADSDLRRRGVTVPETSLAAARQPGYVDRILTHYVGIYFMLCGIEVTVGVPLEYPNTIGNPFGGRPLVGKTRIVLRELRSSAGEVVLEWADIVDEAQSAAALWAVVRRLAPDLAVNQEAGAPAPADVESSATIVMDIKSGLPKTIELSSTRRVGSTGVTERAKITTTLVP